MNSQSESQFYRRFERKFSNSSLPIVGFLEPFFSSIAAYKPKDSKIKGIMVPHLDRMFTGQARARYTLNADNQMIQPDIPFLYDYFKTFCTLPLTGVYGNNNRWTANDTFVPNLQPLGAAPTLVRLGEHEFTVANAAGVNAPITAAQFRPLANVFSDTQTPDSADRYNETLSYWRQSQFKTSGPAITQLAGDIDSLPGFFRMPDYDWQWFEECISTATQHAKFFHGTTNLYNLGVFSGADVGIYSHVKMNVSYTGQPSRINTVPVDGVIPFHPAIHRQSQANFYWYEKNVKDYHRWTARHATSNARVEIYYQFDGNDVDIDANFHTNGANNANRANPSPRFGPFYGRYQDGSSYEHQIIGCEGSSAAPIHVYDGRMEMIQTHFFSATGEGKQNF